MSNINDNNYGTPFDDVFRTLLEKCSKLIIPVINEIFGTDYSMNEEVVLLSNEHFYSDEEGNTKKRITDSCIKIRRKLYHLECESKPDAYIEIRMIEYDFHIALSEAERGAYEHVLTFPESAVLLLRHTSNTPDRLSVRLILPDKSEAFYTIPAVKVQEYDKEEIFDKNLLFFIPYYILRFEKKLKEINDQDEKLKRMVAEYQEIYTSLLRLDIQRTIGPNYLYDLVKLTRKLIEHVARDAENIKREVIVMGGNVIDTGSDAIFKRGISASIIKLLEHKEEVSPELREQILTENDVDILNKWLELSATVSSVEEFIGQMNK